MAEPVVRVRDLRIAFKDEDGWLPVIDGVDVAVAPGRTLCLVGESGCGKSVTGLAIMGLLPEAARVAGGSVLFDGEDLLEAGAERMRALRGDRLSMIFQEPMTSLNPVFTVGDQLTEVILRHRAVSRHEAHGRALEMLRRVRIPAPEQRLREYPHQLSGGMRQRVMIAMALANDPKLLIADEPTTALDVTIQAQILLLIRTLQRETGAAVLLITHDLGVVAEVADDVAVMYAGRIAEVAGVEALFADPQHPYTLGLLASIPRLDVAQERLPTIAGSVPPPRAFPPGCRFSSRCPFADRRCAAEPPPMVEIAPGHRVACWKTPLEDHVGEAPDVDGREPTRV